MKSEEKAWLLLALAETPPNRVRRLTSEQLAELPELAGAHKERALGALGFRPAELPRLSIAASGLEAEVARLAELGATALTRAAPEYPEPLRHLASPPHCLFVLGDPCLLAQPAVALVGTRKPTGYGLAVTRRLAVDLAQAGCLVISGGALGIDAAAHEGALEAGKTIAIFGCGLDVCYPRQHEELFSRIAAQGALVSEFPLGTQPARWRFPARNRILAGLAKAVVVTECSERSGALITAELALEQGSNVGAVPHAIGAEGSEGPHQLLRQGAALVESAEDILELMGGPRYQAPLPGLEPSGPATAPEPEDDFGLEDEAGEALLGLLREGDCTPEELAGRSGLPAAQVASTLTLLEAYGKVLRAPSGRFSLRR